MAMQSVIPAFMTDRQSAGFRPCQTPCLLEARNAARYSRSMRIRHKALRALHERDDPARLPASLVPRLRRILFRLQEATHPGSADAPGFRLHPLEGDRANQWSVRVSGNWRVVFRFEDGEAIDVDLQDYH